jgi:hypothetical protein
MNGVNFSLMKYVLIQVLFSACEMVYCLFVFLDVSTTLVVVILAVTVSVCALPSPLTLTAVLSRAFLSTGGGMISVVSFHCFSTCISFLECFSFKVLALEVLQSENSNNSTELNTVSPV